MRRFTLSTKLFAAATPLIIAVAALLALTVRADLSEISRAQRSEELGGVWAPLSNALGLMEQEVADGYTSRVADDTAIDAGRAETDTALAAVSAAVNHLGLGAAAATHATDAQISVRAGRTAADGAATMNGATRIDPIDSYEAAARHLVSIGQLLPAISDDADLGAELLAIARLSEARVAGESVLHSAGSWNNDPTDAAALTEARSAYTRLEAVLAEFEATAREDWSREYSDSGYELSITDFRTQLDGIIRAQGRGEIRQFDTEGFRTLMAQGVTFEATITDTIVTDASSRADATRNDALVRIGITLVAILVAGLIALWMTRSVTRRVKEVAESANQVASEQLPALVEALRDPRGKSVLPTIAPVSTRGGDELADLAHAFNSMQSTLVDVAHEQVEVLRRGVSDIFVTMARRNRSLIDRQLAMLDEFEAEVDDPDVLSNYYQLDHMATRMRRNSESLLVLANAEPKRRRVKATEIDDVVRAAIGEVEDYRRIEIEALESLQVKGNVVADVSHMLAELLDNATSFSPPDSLVRVGGRKAGDSYMLRIVDNGVGIGVERLRELNELLREPPVVGLSVEPTLGMSVVSLLAHRHSIAVTLSQGSPGTTVDVLLPSTLFGPIDVPMSGAPAIGEPFDLSVGTPAMTPDAPAPAAVAAPAPMRVDTPAAPAMPSMPSMPAMPSEHREPERHVEPDRNPAWSSLSLDLSTLREQPSVDAAPTPAPPVFEPAPAPAFQEPTMPPPARVPHGEFDRPLAPPPTAEIPSRRPVADADAQPAPVARQDGPTDLGLPTRSPGRGPDGGVDRLASFGAGSPGATNGPVISLESSVTATASPSALQAALAAFDSRRNADTSVLPTRSRSEGFAAPVYEEPSSISQSRLDPDALRERLRAFQSEFRTGSTDAAGGTNDTNTSTNNADLGGDRR